MIFLDNNAATEIAPDVIAAMERYSLTPQMPEIAESAKDSVANLLGAGGSEEIFFSSGSEESRNLAINAALKNSQGKNHIITTAAEHPAFLKFCKELEGRNYRVTLLDVDEAGALNIDHLRDALNEQTAVVSVTFANEETGIIFPVDEVAEIVRSASKAFVHIDGTHAAGKVPLDLKQSQIDLFSISADTFHGPKDIGSLYIRNGVNISLKGENKSISMVAGLGAAADLAKDLSPIGRIRILRDRLESEILNKIPNSRLNGTADKTKRLPNTSSISFTNLNGEAIFAKLADAGIMVSTASACNSFDHSPSPVLLAMNIPYAQAMGSIRFSFGRYNREEEVDVVFSALKRIIAEQSAMF